MSDPKREDPAQQSAGKARMSARASGSRFQPEQAPPAPQRTPADMRKLNEWMKLKKKVRDEKDDDPQGCAAPCAEQRMFRRF